MPGNDPHSQSSEQIIKSHSRKNPKANIVLLGIGRHLNCTQSSSASSALKGAEEQ